MCLHVFTGGRLENLPVPDTPQGAGTAEVNMLDMEKTVLSRQRELPAGKRPPAPRHAPWETSLWKHCPLAVAQQHRDPAVERPRPATRISGDNTTPHPLLSQRHQEHTLDHKHSGQHQGSRLGQKL